MKIIETLLKDRDELLVEIARLIDNKILEHLAHAERKIEVSYILPYHYVITIMAHFCITQNTTSTYPPIYSFSSYFLHA